MTTNVASMTAYLHWLQDRGLVSPSSGKSQIPVRAAAAPRVLFVGERLSAAARTLLDKMIAAMRLLPEEAQFVESIDAARAPVRPELVIMLGKRTAHAPLDADGPILTTHHPATLLAYPALKREAWADLNVAMERLGLATTGALR